MDFIIFHDDYLLGDDDILLTQALNYKPPAMGHTKTMGATHSSGLSMTKDRSFDATALFHPPAATETQIKFN